MEYWRWVLNKIKGAPSFLTSIEGEIFLSVYIGVGGFSISLLFFRCPFMSIIFGALGFLIFTHAMYRDECTWVIVKWDIGNG